MTDQMVTTAPVETEADRKAALIAEGEKYGLKLDRRYAVERMEAKIAEAKASPGLTHEDVGTAALPPGVDEMQVLKAKLAAAEAALAAQTSKPAVAPPVEPRRGPPPGTLTSLAMNQPPEAAMKDAELAAMWEQATRLGIAGAIPKGASVEQIGERITRHLAAKAQEQAILDEQARQKAMQPPIRLVDARILPMGDNKISRGVHIPGVGDLKYRRGEFIHGLPFDIASVQQENGYLEILDAPSNAI